MGGTAALCTLATLLCLYTVSASNVTCSSIAGSFYNLSATDINMNPVQFNKFAGKVTLALNVASFWGMTVTNYQQLNQLVAQLGTALNVLAFPCAQFNNQEPAHEPEILNCLKYVRPGSSYVPNFPMFAKIAVNGASTHLVYQFLKGRCGPTSPEIGDTQYISWTPVNYNDITWNFEKFLITKTGQVYRRYDPTTPPLDLLYDIKVLMAQ